MALPGRKVALSSLTIQIGHTEDTLHTSSSLPNPHAHLHRPIRFSPVPIVLAIWSSLPLLSLGRLDPRSEPNISNHSSMALRRIAPFTISSARATRTCFSFKERMGPSWHTNCPSCVPLHPLLKLHLLACISVVAICILLRSNTATTTSHSSVTRLQLVSSLLPSRQTSPLWNPALSYLLLMTRTFFRRTISSIPSHLTSPFHALKNASSLQARKHWNPLYLFALLVLHMSSMSTRTLVGRAVSMPRYSFLSERGIRQRRTREWAMRCKRLS
ncbi:hypothetical protein D6C83_06700 [Aureobasidium pullulans]|uniref:Uncharacterized protein n=1 Tax=Aureobasidium pullulans TaxID=5580 RepID=A0A4T0BMA0_AURPU|nr:hypothetical protein D6C83_06700 [Aureobasidium pullulans]